MKTLKEIVDAQAAVYSAADEYWRAHVQPRLDACTNRQQFQEVRGDVSLACSDDENQIREMPADYSVRFIIESTRFK